MGPATPARNRAKPMSAFCIEPPAAVYSSPELAHSFDRYALWSFPCERSYGSANATISAVVVREPTDTAMYCLPLIAYVIGLPQVPPGSVISCTTAPVALS